MKKLIAIATAALIISPAQAGWFDWLSGDAKDDKPQAEAEAAAPEEANATSSAGAALALIPSLTSTLGVSEPQASGGAGALLQVAQSTLSTDEFSTLSGFIPEAGALLDAAPGVAGDDSAVGSMLKTAEQYHQTAKVVSQVNSQFSALGLDPAMIAPYIGEISSFLQSSGGQVAVDLFSKAMTAFI